MVSQFETKLKDLKLSRTVQFSVLFFFFAVFFYTLKTRYWSDSEIWSIRQAALCTQSWSGFACSWKPLFNFLIGATHLLVGDQSIVDLMNACRALMIAVWLFVIWIAFRHRMSGWLLICYVGSSVFFFDSSVARSDFFALPFILLHIHLLLTPQRSTLRAWLCFFSATAAVLVTPKALITLVCFAPYYVLPVRGFIHRIARKNLKAILFFYIALIGGAFIVSWGDIFLFFVRLFQEENYRFAYWDSNRLLFVWRSLTENPQFPLLIITWLFLVVQNSQGLSRSRISSLLLLFSILLFPDRLPFWISCQFFIFIFTASNDFSSSLWANRIAVALAIFAVANGVHWIDQMKSFSNERQISLVHSVESLLKQSPQAKVYDGLGLFLYPSRNGKTASSLFFGPGQTALNLETVEKIKKETFDVVVVTHKVEMFEFALREDFQRHFLEATGGIFVRVLNISIQDTKHPGVEIQESLRRLVPEKLHDFMVGRPTFVIAVTSEGETHRFLSKSANGFAQSLFSFEDLPNLPKLCERCKNATVAIVPTGQFLMARIGALFSEEFAFEPSPLRAPRVRLFHAVYPR